VSFLRALALPLGLLAVAAVAVAAPTHLQLRDEARAAYQRQDYAAALRATEAALALRPDSPRYLHNLAALSARLDRPEEALAALQRLADLGVVTDITRDLDLAPLQGTPGFLRVLSRFAANREPRGSAELFAEFSGRTGLVEGIAYRASTGELFLSDVHHRCIWRRARTGEVTRFTAPDEELFGIFGLALDERRNTLWATTAAVPEMAGFEPAMKGHAALAEFDLRTGELRRLIPVPDDGRDHALSDLFLAADGTVFASDSKAPVVWQFAPDAEEPQKAVDSPLFSSLQGLMIEGGILLVADYANGLFAVELATRNITAIPSPPGTTLLGIDALVPFVGGALVTQNGVAPQRVLQLGFAPDFSRITHAKVLASGLPDLTDLTLATIADGQPIVIAGSGWETFDLAKAKEPPPHTVRVFRIAVE
jgi:hypothetical protein